MDKGLLDSSAPGTTPAAAAVLFKRGDCIPGAGSPVGVGPGFSAAQRPERHQAGLRGALQGGSAAC